MSLSELHLALLLTSPRHGYEVKKQHDAWFPEAKPLAFGQVYATLGRLVRDGLAEVVETRSDGGPERTVYSVTVAGRERLEAWLSEPAPPAGSGGEDIVRKTVVALRTPRSGQSANEVVARQRTAHLRRMRELQQNGDEGTDVAVQLARRHAVLHLDADLRWLEEAVQTLSVRPAALGVGGGPAARPGDSSPAPSPHPMEGLA
ncbi:MAG: PadR family transcriptional regulator [Propionibacteriales bacterium]|nr:PadR family transcriptional regulator [Propionibacteriales bacterium]